MSINGALHIGRTALLASQTGMQATGNNMANAATEGYARRTTHLQPLGSELVAGGARVGLGVEVASIRREIDTALQLRFRNSISDNSAALIDQRFLTSLETLQNELTENDLSTMLSEFFNTFSELGNNPEDSAVRSVVIEQGANLASRINSLRDDYNVVVDEVDRQLAVSSERVNEILQRVADLNLEIANTEFDGSEAAGLRDQRDLLIDELAEYVDVTVIEQANGSADILVNSTPILLGTTVRGVELRTESVGDRLEVSLRVAADGTDIKVRSGSIGALLNQREGTIQPVLDALDDFTGQLIFQVNRLHSQGQGQRGFSSVTGTYVNTDATANLNASATGLPFTVGNGSFTINVTHKETGARSSYQIFVDGNANSLDDIINEINNVVGVPNVTAGKGLGDRFTLDAAAGYEISFSDDTSGALASLGVNTFFTGQGASDIAVNDVVRSDPTKLAAGNDHIPGSNGTAVAIANLQDVAIDDLKGQSLREFWYAGVNELAVKTDAANANTEATGLIKENLYGQMQAVSGVSLDEESINLLTFQRQFQAAARFISVIDETLQTLLSIA
jgi:flagellar hook-associated protein 1 FlgK